MREVISRSYAHIALGMEYRRAGLLREAKRELETAVRLTPDSQKAHYQLGLVLIKLGEQKRGKAELATVESLKHSSDEKIAWQLAVPPGKGVANLASKGR